MQVAQAESTQNEHDCCSMPAGGEEPARAPEPGQFQECCFRVTPATVSKGSPAEVRLVAVSERPATGIEPAIRPDFTVQIEIASEDSSSDYLLFRVLRI